MELVTKAYVSIDIKVGERMYQFYMPVGAPYGEAYDAAFSVSAKILELAKDAVDKSKQSSEPDAPKADS